MARAVLSLATLALLLACGPQEGSPPDPVIEVVARGLSFEAPDSVPSGWVTVRFRNESPMVHFALIERMPPGTGAAAQQAEVAPVFQEGMNLLAAGDADAAGAAFAGLPAWFGEVVFLGGPGLTAPGRTSEVTIRLEPGTYLLECYVKTAGVFHSFNPEPGVMGMVHEFTVTEAASPLAAPSAAVRLTLSGESGLTMDGDPRAGPGLVEVRFADQAVHANFVGHDVHLFRIADDTDLSEVVAWMDWTRPGGLQTPAPVQFVGGLNEMPAGAVGYLGVTLEPGRYAWIAEVPDAESAGLLLPFEVERPAP